MLAEGDSYAAHVDDTLVAGAGLCDLEATQFTVENAPGAIAWLQELGVPFSTENGELHLTREGGHTHRRIVHATDATGAAVQATLQAGTGARFSYNNCDTLVLQAVHRIGSTGLGIRFWRNAQACKSLICCRAPGSSMVVRSPGSRASHTAWMARRSSLPERVLGSVVTKRTRAGRATAPRHAPSAAGTLALWFDSTSVELFADGGLTVMTSLHFPRQPWTSLVLATDERDAQGAIKKTQVWLLLLRGDHEMNEVKAGKLPGLADFRFATAAEIEEHFGAKAGYLGPVGVKQSVNVVADRDVAVMADWICGANEEGFHIRGVNWWRDLPEPMLVADIRNVVAGDLSPDGKGALAIERGIEVGHVFYLGTIYSKDMYATFLDENGKPLCMEMGCYGIGISRLPAAAIEQNHDEKGIIWPDAIAPFTVVVCPIHADRSPEVKTASETLYAQLLAAGVDVILDDRGERPGAMFADWELIGVPHRITIGDRTLKAGQVEYQHRRDAEATQIPLAEASAFVRARLTV